MPNDRNPLPATVADEEAHSWLLAQRVANDQDDDFRRYQRIAAENAAQERAFLASRRPPGLLRQLMDDVIDRGPGAHWYFCALAAMAVLARITHILP